MIQHIYSPGELPSAEEKTHIAQFLFRHLDQYGDPENDILKAIDYALGINGSPGGCLIVVKEGTTITGAVVLNVTGMKDYIPENILVYIATHADYRGKGIGKRLMELAVQNTEGAIALHVEPDNPAKKLYERFGFSNKYLEMRLQKQ